MTIPCFNEAGGFLPRKLEAGYLIFDKTGNASMRPEDFSPGNAVIEIGEQQTSLRLQ